MSDTESSGDTNRTTDRILFLRPERCLLAVRAHGKAIPYHAVPRTSDETSNHGFVALKGRPAEEIRAIPEASGVKALERFLVIVNDIETPFFSVGCEKAFNFDARWGHWGRGYVEFSFNHPTLAADAQNYFKLFFEFSRRLALVQPPVSVSYCWELDRAEFVVTKTTGFTVAVWVQTDDMACQEEVVTAWCHGLDVLTEFLGEYSRCEMPTIY